MNPFAGLIDLAGPIGSRQIWADARLDRRPELILKFDPAVRKHLSTESDAELILHAYSVWGKECIEHLTGDFCFALWDDRHKWLFCARDQFGIKPFFFSSKTGFLVFGNSLDAVRTHAGITSALNELAIADFLVFGSNRSPFTTVFADVQRLPAGHSLTWHSGTSEVHRYWALRVPEPLHYRRSSDYIDQFHELLTQAVSDRAEPGRTAILMSGGLDSTMVAATARQTTTGLKAFTIVYDRLVPDPERYYSGVAATAIDIPIDYLAADAYNLYQRSSQLHTPEPVDEPLLAIFTDHMRQVSTFSSVALSGQGGDAIFYPSPAFAFRMIKTGHIPHLLSGIAQYMRIQKRVPPLGLRSAVRRLFRPGAPAQSEYPTWLNPELENELNLPARWQQYQTEPASIHRDRPEAYSYLTNVFWPNLFETYDPSFTTAPVEVRHPLFDLRLIEYLLAVPPIPWFINKTLPRAAMKPYLPEAVRLRAKARVRCDPVAIRLRQNAWIDEFEAHPVLDRFVDRKNVPVITRSECTPWWPNLRPLSLNFWLQYLTQPVYTSTNKYEVGQRYTEKAV